MTPEKKIEQVEVLIEALIKLNEEENESHRLETYDLIVVLKLIQEILETVQPHLANKNI